MEEFDEVDSNASYIPGSKAVASKYKVPGVVPDASNLEEEMDALDLKDMKAAFNAAPSPSKGAIILSSSEKQKIAQEAAQTKAQQALPPAEIANRLKNGYYRIVKLVFDKPNPTDNSVKDLIDILLHYTTDYRLRQHGVITNTTTPAQIYANAKKFLKVSHSNLGNFIILDNMPTDITFLTGIRDILKSVENRNIGGKRTRKVKKTKKRKAKRKSRR
jgi:hypothetical protein